MCNYYCLFFTLWNLVFSSEEDERERTSGAVFLYSPDFSANNGMMILVLFMNKKSQLMVVQKMLQVKVTQTRHDLADH